jgi:uncharacterized protein
VLPLAGRVLLTAAVGTAGGALAMALGLPAAWLAGSMAAVAAATLAGAPVDVPPRLRDAAFVLLGASMGGSVTPDTVAAVVAWPLSLALLAGSVAATLAAGSLYLRRVHRWDAATARFASVPGAFSAVVVLAASSEADLPRVALAQSVRIAVLVALTPSLLELGGSLGTPAGQALAAPVASGAADLALTLAASAAAGALLAAVRVPGGVLLGAMTASALLHAAGLVEGRPPAALLTAGFVATGAVIGTRFRGTTLANLRGTLPGALGSVLIALAIAAAFAAAGARLLGLPFGQLWLAYAPGGVEAMAAMALALALDPAFVGAHHVLRLLALNLVAPLWLLRRGPKPRT